MTRPWIALAAPASLIVATSASAQELTTDLVIQPSVAQDLSRGQNVSVAEQPRPDYSPVGLSIGGLRFNPRVEIGTGASSNLYLLPDDHTEALFLYQRVSARLTSTWTRHSLQVSASTARREYLGESERNEDVWALSATGRLDISKALRIDSSVNASKGVENLFSGEVNPTVAALSQYRRDFGSVRATYTQGRVRTFVMFDGLKLRFLPVDLRAGGELDQGSRDREISRVTAQVEYARSPSVALFAQVSGTRTVYDELARNGAQNQDSKSVRVLGGLNVDISGRIRGTIGVGYSIRNYDSPLYSTVSGFSGEAQVETFPTERLTLSLTARRTIEDIASGALRPSFNTRTNFRADYEVLRNLIINATAGYTHQPRSGDTYRAGAGSRYLMSRRLNFDASATYSRRVSTSVSEARVEASLSYQL